MISRVGKSHIKRDWQQTKIDSSFPAGEDLRSMFLKDFLDFESFACDAVNCLEDLNIGDPASMLANDILRSIHLDTEKEVKARLDKRRDALRDSFGVKQSPDEETEDSIARLFWYHTLQSKMYKEIQEIQVGIVPLGESSTKLHDEMVLAEKENRIEQGESALRLPQLVLLMLKFHTIAALSDPRCYLYPAPGARIPYKESSYTMEVLSPGTKTHGRIQEGDEVEVVFSGLYFEELTTENFLTNKAAEVPLVRRLAVATESE
jgi:hypothetical protein